MSRRYFRKGSGQFRGPTLAYFGMACCEKRGAIFSPAIPDHGPFVDPKVFNEARRLCADCGGLGDGKSTGLVAKDGDPPRGQGESP